MLGEQLRDARQAAGLTQEELAFEAGVDRTYVSIVERDIQSPSLDTFIRLCRALGVKPSAILQRIEGAYRPKKRKPRGS